MQTIKQLHFIWNSDILQNIQAPISVPKLRVLDAVVAEALHFE